MNIPDHGEIRRPGSSLEKANEEPKPIDLTFSYLLDDICRLADFSNLIVVGDYR